MKQLKNIFKPIHLMFENISFLGTKYKKNQVNIEGNTDCFVEAWDSRCIWWRVRPIESEK